MNLAKTQFLSLLTKAVTTALGIIQSVIVVRLLSPGEFGLVGLVMSIGGVIGVSQHLGIVDGAIREIAVRKDPRDISKVFWVSNIVRQAVTIPLSLGLVGLAPLIATRLYGRPEITHFIQMFAVVLILQGFQDVLGATLTGMKKFIPLYAIQIITAAVNIVIFGYLTWAYGIAGFFYAVIITTAIMVVLISFTIARYLRPYLALPTREDVRQFGRRLLRIGAFMYAARIFFVVWQRLPLLALGGVVASDQLGYLNVSLTFGARLTIIAMALSEVNLSLMSSLFTTQRTEFVRIVTRNMHRVLVLMSALTLSLLFFTPEILQYVIGSSYLPAEPLIYSMTLAFFLYSLTDIGTSSIFVSADNPKLRALIYGLMISVTGLLTAWLFVASPNALLASLAVLGGAAAAYILMIYLAQRHYQIHLLTRPLGVFMAALATSVLWLLTEPELLWRIIIFLALVVYITREAHRNKLLPRLEFKNWGEKPAVMMPIICFAGAAYEQTSWTNRQHMMSRIARSHPVLYIEPRIWIIRFFLANWRNPTRIVSFIKRLWWYERKGERLYVKAQWNLLPGSREIHMIASINHFLNRWNVLLFARLLGFRFNKTCIWIYDTEACEYLNAFSRAFVLYDCVDDHAAQSGVDRNSQRVEEEELAILERADLVTVTSHKLLDLKRGYNPNTVLVLNAGDVALYRQTPSPKDMVVAQTALRSIPRPYFGSVGALDAYKMDFALLHAVVSAHPDWHFIFIGEPVVDRNARTLDQLRQLCQLPNVHLLGPVPRAKVPAYIYQFDVCLIPYQSNRYNAASFPLKFWEFMATGKPIIATGVPELKNYVPAIAYASSAEDFIDQASACLARPEQSREERIALAREHSWEKRVEHVLNLLHDKVAVRIK